MSRFPYKFFDHFIVRSPLLSNKKYQSKSAERFSDFVLKEIFSDPVFQEAIYLASPYLYEELKLWLSGKDFQKKQLQKLQQSVLKYYIRMSARCVPFGLFSGAGVGRFVNQSDHSAGSGQNTPASFQKCRETKLDMHFLTALSKHIAEKAHIQNQLIFYPNNSIYKVGNRLRYVEYETNGDKRNYVISTVVVSDELLKILNHSENGSSIHELAELLVNNEITKEESIEFIRELIANSILVSELEPKVSGNDFFEEILQILTRVQAKEEVETLLLIRDGIQNLDEKIGNSLHKYEEIEQAIRSLGMEYEKKYLFQTDLYFKNEYQMPSRWISELKKGISFLNKISLPATNTHLETFKKNFQERFDNEEVPLSYALDSEAGIGYRQDINSGAIHPYLEGLEAKKNKRKRDLDIRLNPLQIIMNQKLQAAFRTQETVIKLSDDDFKDFEENWDDLPDTISFMGELVSEENIDKVYLYGISGGGAAELMGRFCSEKSEIKNLTRKICDKEDELNDDAVLAEVIHLPDARTGNVIRRPVLRKYEIPYLTRSVLPKENQIPVSDLFISLKNNRIVLRSRRFGKEVKPRLTNAHNYYANSLPVYHFLCDFHSQDIRSNLHFDWGGLSQLYFFLPRVEYKNIILSKARWKISIKDISSLESISGNEEDLISHMKIWRAAMRIPEWVQWTKSDNILPLNLNNPQMVLLFIETIKKEQLITIEEFLWNDNENFRHQFIFPLYKEVQDIRK